ncbi:MAG TPA: hypothetical protein P5572_18950, partial [Phycisphaerae bacterium]|nr:hypothetical protein [Phycisphaerae bacterium]
IGVAALAAHSLINLPDWCDPLVRTFQGNPAAALLLGAILLALLVGGSGPVAADRTLERRRRLRRDALTAPAPTA